MWSAIIEKAWAKMKGTYTSADTGFNVNGLRALTGAPVFTYDTDEQKSAYDTWKLLKEAEESNYLATTATIDPTVLSDEYFNDCGIANNHAFSIISVFSVNVGLNTEFLYAMRNPWGVANTHNMDWNQDDANWKDQIIQQIPLEDVDPRTSSQEEGIFFLNEDDFLTCF